ncbi:pentatricopeptide repeat-containing protein At5g39350-like [Euphorbia lathyris]|uniref:pentatricopeptide repeat-containing protein At5g39350-like n=1 Tax=Euphorbia lathyris TaxID=212925 RepID=UPI0033133A3D
MYYSFNSKAINLLHFLPRCKTPIHLRCFKSLLVLHGLIDHKGLLRHLLNSCFRLGAVDLALSTFNSIRKPSGFLQNLVIRGLSNLGLHENVLSVYLKSRSLSCPSDDFTFPFVTKACSNLGNFRILKLIHCVVLRSGYDQNVVIQTALIDFYAKNGCIEIARKLTDKIPQPDLIAWNALLSGYSYNGCDYEVFGVIKEIFSAGLNPNLSTLASLIPVCTRLRCLDIGTSVHGFAVKSGYLVNDFLVPALISMYASDENLSAAGKLFELVEEKNVSVWNAMISALAQNRMPFEALEVFQKMQFAEIQPNFVTFVSIVPSCEISGSIWLGESLHGCIIKHGLKNHVSVSTALLSMYAKLGDVDKCEFLFNSTPNRNILSWNVMVSGYVHNGLMDAGLVAFSDMQLDGFTPNSVSIISVLSACSKLEASLLGKSVHGYSIRKGISSDLNVSNALLSFYSACNNLASSFKLFVKMGTRDSVSWNTLISGFVRNGEFEKAAELLHQQQQEGLTFDLVTLISVLPMCCDSAHLSQGMALHSYAIKNGFVSEISLANALISMYFRCGSLDAGRLLFEEIPERSVVSWNALIGGYRRYDLSSDVFATFKRMVIEKEKPNSVTLLNLLPVCCSELQGKSIHAFSIRADILRETPLLTSLIFMYSRFSNMNFCLSLFEKSEKKDISLWNTMISVQTQANNAEKAVSFFRDLLQFGIQPDNITILSLISAYAQVNSSKLADSVMAYVISKGFDKEVSISNALIDLYAKCGSIFVARKIFDGVTEKDPVCWNAMLNGYSLHGDGEAAFELFLKMKLTGIRPNEITFLSILSACSHSGLVEQALMVFNSMDEQGIPAKSEHFACIIDVLGRTGEVKEAYEIVKKLQFKPPISLLESLLGACRNYGDVEIGEKVSQMLIEMEPENPGPYVMLSNIYAGVGRWIDADRVRSIIEARKLRKVPGFSLGFRG